MKLYDFLKMYEKDCDTSDIQYDTCVTVSFIDEDKAEDNYDKFCIELTKKVEIVSIFDYNFTCYGIVCDWSKLVTDNIEKFRAFTLDHWHKDAQYDGEDEQDDFILAWINEIHYLLAGYVSEDFYDVLVKFVETLN